MDKLQYSLIVDKSIKRRIAILSNLENKPYSIKDLATFCEASDKTILVTINNLKEELPKTVYIEEVGKNHYTLTIEDYFELMSYKKAIVKESPLFTIVESIFEGQILTIESIAEHLFVSESSVRKYLFQLENVLEEYKLTLNYKTLDINGEEGDIRYFFFCYFRYGHEASSLLKERHQNSSAIQDALSLSHKTFGNVFNLDYERLLLWLMVFEKRIELKKNIKLESRVINKHVDKDLYKRFYWVFNQVFKNNHILRKISEEEIIYAYIARLSCVVYEKSSIYFSMDYEGDLKQFDGMVRSFFATQDLHPTKYLELSMIIECFLTNLTMLSDISPLFQKVNGELKEQIKGNFNSLYLDWLKILDGNVKWVYQEDIAVNLALLSSVEFNINVYKFKKVLFVLTGEPTALAYYKAIVQRLLPKDLEIYFLFNTPTAAQILDTLEIDIVVSNLSIPISDSNIISIRLSDTPSIKEWEALFLKLYTF